MYEPDLSNLPACIDDALQALSAATSSPPRLPEYDRLLALLSGARPHLPAGYDAALITPVLAQARGLGPYSLAAAVEQTGFLPLADAMHAILQATCGFSAAVRPATRALQEVVADLYEGFLSKEERHGLKCPDHLLLPPLVKWGPSSRGPYTIPIEQMSQSGLGCALVNLPLCNARHGLISWPSLSHETTGHDILRADIGLVAELQGVIRARLEQSAAAGLTAAFLRWFDEVTADILSALNLGPAAGLGFIGHFRAASALHTGQPLLRASEPASRSYPPDIVRGFLLVAVVARLRFAQAAAWSQALLGDIYRDVRGPLLLAEGAHAPAALYEACEIVVDAVIATPLAALGGLALSELQNWSDDDEAITSELRAALTSAQPLPAKYAPKFYAAHALAAAVTAAAASGASVPPLFAQLQQMLCTMHANNPSWPR